MSLENIQLPDFVLAELFTNNLVILDEQQQVEKILQTVEKNNKPGLQFLGDNKKAITIVVKDDSAVHLNDQSLNFLSNILVACKLNLGDVAIVNLATQTTDLTQLQNILKPAFVILFDIKAVEIQLPFIIPDYQVQAYNNCSFLFATSLQDMLGTTDAAKIEKSKLWVSLKKMFGI